MPKFSQSNFQIQKNSIKKALSAEGIQLQQLLLSQSHEIEQIVNQELSYNPALVIEEEPDFSEDMEPDEDGEEIWNQDFDKPYNEYETGERLKVEDGFDHDEYDIASKLQQTVIEYFDDNPQDIDCALRDINLYRISGELPVDADNQLREDLKILQKSMSYTALPSISPTFEVLEESGNVEVYIVSTIADSLNYRKGFGKYSNRAKKFINQTNRRSLYLSNLATWILKNIQGEFFRQTDINEALKYLIPVTVKNIAGLEIDFALKLDKKMMSKLSDLLVACKFGVFPLGFFLPSKAVTVRLWSDLAQKSGITKIKDQCESIKQQFRKRIDGLDSDDRRLDLLKPLLEINVNDIKNARKKVKSFSNPGLT